MKLYHLMFVVPLYACGGAFVSIPADPPDADPPDQHVGLHPDADAGLEAEAGQDAAPDAHADVLDAPAGDAPPDSPPPPDAPLPDAPPEAAPDVGPLCPHSNGLGQVYDDCAHGLGVPGDGSSYRESMANEAASVWPGAGQPALVMCGGEFCMQAAVGTQCASWCFSGTVAGYVATGPCLPTPPCPNAANTTWN
jgi:hypothetical protein